MLKIATHTFDGGLNTDVNDRALGSNQYTSATNISLSSNDGFRVVTPIKGSTLINALGAYTDIKILGQFDTVWQYNGSPKACVTLVAVLDSHYVIWACPTDGSTPVKIFDKTTTNPNDYQFATGEVYSENGVDFLYYTDGVDQPKQIRCVIPNSGAFTPLNENELSILKRAPLGVSISNFTINNTGGSLLCGSYQSCIRLYNSTTNRYSAWTIPINPIRIHQVQSVGTDMPNATRGSATTKSIDFALSFNDATEKALYSHYQLGIIENTSTDSPSLLMSVLPVEPLPVGSSTTFTYAQNQKVASVSIDEVVVEPAPVRTAETLTIKDNRLFLGNVTYKDLEYDNGIPVFDNTSNIATFAPDISFNPKNWYSDDDYSSRYVGHFRDEVYRFAISYWDENYNFSPPSILNMDVIGNAIVSGSHRDLRFPDRSTSGYTLFNSSGVPQALGLTLRSLTNHPSWAKGFVILRAKRQKNILFQSPFIPAMKVQPAAAFNKYPTEATQSLPTTAGNRTRSTATFTSAQPGINTLGTYSPKNLFQGLSFNIERRLATGASGTQIAGQAVYDSNTTVPVWITFPTGDMFQSPSGAKLEAYQNASGDSYRTTEIALFKVNYTNSSDNDLSYDLGDFVNTEIEGRFYADTRDLYYTSNIGGTSSGFVTTDGGSLKDYVFIDTFDTGKVMDTGEPVEQYDGVLATGFIDGFKPTTLKKAYVRPNDNRSDTPRNMYDAARASVGNLLGVSAGTVFVNGTRLESDYLFGGTGLNQGYGNKFIVAAPGFSNDTIAQGIIIANIERGLGNDRYGDIDTYQEFIYTGTSYEFSSIELASLEAGANITTNTGGIDVWGGDCFLPYVQYKLGDTTFAISDDRRATTTATAQTSEEVADKFFYSFATNNSAPIRDQCRPVPLKAASQIVSCFIESSYNLDNLTRSGIYNTGISSNNILKLASTSKEQYRLPLSYVVQPELSFQNSYKIWVPKLTDIVSPTEYKSRILISDQKIYQSDVKGFDTFKAASFYDLDETYGDIVRLLVSENRMYAVQNSAITYVPVNINQIETADGVSLSITTGAVIGKPVILTNKYGGQNVSAITASDIGFFVADQIKGKIVEVRGDSVGFITDAGVIRTFESLLSPSKNTYLSFNLKDRQLYVGVQTSGNEADYYVFDKILNQWVTRLSTLESTPNLFLSSGLSQGTFVVFGQRTGFNSNQLSYVSWGTNPQNTHLGKVMVSKLGFVFNPTPQLPKIFDDLIINATNTFDNLNCTVERDSDFGNQVVTGMPIIDARYDANYYVAILRDSNQERLAGATLGVELFWPNAAITSESYKLASVLLKYRERKPRF